jgi:GTP cyclohydrolase I
LLPDVQSSADTRNLAIQRVGVKRITVPVRVAGAQGVQASVATVEMMVGLPPSQKGTHMSRFLEMLDAHLGPQGAPLSAAALRDLMAAMLLRLEADTGWIELRFPYFVRKQAPVSGVASLMDYRVTLSAERRSGTAATAIVQTIVAPVTALCPCSKEVSEFGAHNQRAHLTLTVRVDPDAAADATLDLDAQIRIAEDAASSELWAVLKRVDEKFVTEHAYLNPRFVEDMVRDLALRLERDPRALSYRVEAENFESIHNHSAYALIESDKPAARG